MSSQRRRAVALAVVALVHGALGWLLVASVTKHAPAPITVRETILYLPQPRPVMPAPVIVAPSAPVPAPRSAAPPPVPSYNFVAPAPDTAPLFAAPSKDLRRLMQGCAADTLATLPPEERARCRVDFGMVERRDPTNDPREKIRDERYWAMERAAAHTPLNVPCVSMFSRPIPGLSAADQGVMADPLCVIGELRKKLE